MNEPDRIDMFAEWMVGKGYAPRSARKAAGDLRTMLQHGSEPPNAVMRRTRIAEYRWAHELYSAFADERGLPAFEVDAPELPASDPRVGRGLRKEPQRLRTAVSLAPEDWTRFSRVVEADDSLPARVIRVLNDTGFRISDVLRATRAQIEAGFARTDGITTFRLKGSKDFTCSVHGAAAAWKSLLDGLRSVPRSATVAEAISEGSAPEAGSAAYHACRRKLFELAKKADVSGRVHLHRLRRTVLVGGLRAGETLETMQQVGGHASRSTTAGYADEKRALDAAEALKRTIAKRDGGR